MKTIGIIGGLGPETTSKFYLEIIGRCQKSRFATRPRIVIANVPIGIKEEKEQLLKGEVLSGTRKLLVDAARTLERSGADLVVMPCNSLHVCAEDIQNSIAIPFVSILDASAKFLRTRNIKEVGLLSTNITSANKLYEKRLAAEDIVTHSVTQEEQMRLDALIVKLVSNRYGKSERDEFASIACQLKEKSGALLLACTDLQLLMASNTSAKIFDTMSILAQEVIEILKT
jgi:aspartate racemase